MSYWLNPWDGDPVEEDPLRQMRWTSNGCFIPANIRTLRDRQNKISEDDQRHMIDGEAPAAAPMQHTPAPAAAPSGTIGKGFCFNPAKAKRQQQRNAAYANKLSANMRKMKI